jgi:hypothetical protein
MTPLAPPWPGTEVLVADGYGNARIHEFSPEGEWRSSFGEIGSGPREFMTPHSLIVDREQRLLVCDEIYLVEIEPSSVTKLVPV